jgi:hypothetical protein
MSATSSPSSADAVAKCATVDVAVADIAPSVAVPVAVVKTLRRQEDRCRQEQMCQE